ncbi:MAG: FecCD transport family, partial [Bacteroidota bacterium]
MHEGHPSNSSSTAVHRRGLRPRLPLLLGILLGLILFLDLEPFSPRWTSPGGDTIFWDLHFPRVIAAAIGGIALSWSGLMMQTLFR